MTGPVDLIVCTTCRGPGGMAGVGKELVAEVARLAAKPAYAAVAVAPAACLWSCAQGASAQLRGADRVGYVMGGFAVGDARALLDFAAAYAASVAGEVPYRDWPSGVLGHFIARTPPADGRIG